MHVKNVNTYCNIYILYLLFVVTAESSVDDVGPKPEPVIQSVSSSSHAPGTSVINDGGGTTVGGTYTGVIKSSPISQEICYL